MPYIAYPYLDDSISVIDTVIHRSRTKGVDAVMVEGEVIYQNGQFIKVDKEPMLTELSNAILFIVKVAAIKNQSSKSILC